MADPKLKQALKDGEFVVAPGVFDLISALIADTIARLSPLVPAERVLVVTSADIADALHDAIPEVPRANMLIEPRPLGTAAALAWGAFLGSAFLRGKLAPSAAEATE